MAIIYNSKVTEELRDGGKISLRDVIPNQLAEKVVPVMEVNPKMFRRINLVKSSLLNNATSATIWTTETNKDTFLVGATLCYLKDATSTATYVQMRITPEGQATTTILQMPTLTLTAGTGELSISLPNPIKLDKGSTVTISTDTNVANIRISGCIFMYSVDNITA